MGIKTTYYIDRKERLLSEAIVGYFVGPVMLFHGFTRIPIFFHVMYNLKAHFTLFTCTKKFVKALVLWQGTIYTWIKADCQNRSRQKLRRPDNLHKEWTKLPSGGYTYICDQDKISHYSINTILSRKVMRIKKTTC